MKEEAECVHASDDDDDSRSPLNIAYYHDFGEPKGDIWERGKRAFGITGVHMFRN